MTRLNGLAITARAFAVARWRARTLTTRARIEHYQRRRLTSLERHLTRDIAFYHGRGGFADWPIIDKEVMLAEFDRMNVAGLTLDRVRDTLARDEATLDGFGIGHSTGTSGNRGYFVVSEAERFVWLGTLLAKALPDALWRRRRVALALPGFSRLYRSADGGSRVALGLFDLTEGVDALRARMAAFAPDTIVAPPKALRLLAERRELTAGTIFSAAETLDPLDRAAIEGVTGRPVREVYMATEGLFGVSCAHGTLHLAEDVVHFEWEPAAGGSALVQPIVTDFTRRAQAMARYRMNDLLLLAGEPCACGSAFRTVQRIEGRSDDIFLLKGLDGELRPVTPDVLRNALVDSDRAITEFRIVQTGASAIKVRLPDGQGDQAKLRAAFAEIAERMALGPLAIEVERGVETPLDTKLRRVMRAWSPNQSSAVAS